jgi:hypothetical protein
MGVGGEAARGSIHGGVTAFPRGPKPDGFPLLPLGLEASRLALDARAVPDVNVRILSTHRCGQH